MRIEAYNQVNQLYKSNKPSKSQKAEKSSFSDQLQISSIGKDIQNAKQAVVAAPNVREDLTAPIKASIDAGTYNVSGGDFASKLLEKYEAAGNI